MCSLDVNKNANHMIKMFVTSLAFNYKNYDVLKWKIRLVWGSTLLKIRITSKKRLK